MGGGYAIKRVLADSVRADPVPDLPITQARALDAEAEKTEEEEYRACTQKAMLRSGNFTAAKEIIL